MNSIAFARKKMLENKEQISELKYEGNIGLAEVMNFYLKAKKNRQFDLITKVENLISNNKTKDAWKIILDYIGASLEGK
jgi:hypothetical protein